MCKYCKHKTKPNNMSMVDICLKCGNLFEDIKKTIEVKKEGNKMWRRIIRFISN